MIIPVEHLPIQKVLVSPRLGPCLSSPLIPKHVPEAQIPSLSKLCIGQLGAPCTTQNADVVCSMVSHHMHLKKVLEIKEKVMTIEEAKMLADLHEI